MIQRRCSPSGGAHLPVLCKRERTMKVPESGVKQSNNLLGCAPVIMPSHERGHHHQQAAERRQSLARVSECSERSPGITPIQSTSPQFIVHPCSCSRPLRLTICWAQPTLQTFLAMTATCPREDGSSSSQTSISKPAASISCRAISGAYAS